MTTLLCPIIYFSTLYDSQVFIFEFNKGLECSKSPMKTILLLFDLSNKRITFLLSLLIVIYSFFAFIFFFL